MGPFTTLQCSSNQDCTKFASHPTCKGNVATCDTSRGVCRALGVSGHGGDLCISKTVTNKTTNGVQLLINAETSVAGYVLVEVQSARSSNGSETWQAVSGFTLQDSDPMQGNSLSAVASWGAGSMASLSDFAGK